MPSQQQLIAYFSSNYSR